MWLPQTESDLVIPERFLMSHREERFLNHDNGISIGKRNIMFPTQRFLDILSSSLAFVETHIVFEYFEVLEDEIKPQGLIQMIVPVKKKQMCTRIRNQHVEPKNSCDSKFTKDQQGD
ncbi:hypothetical protein RF11_16422 [Thelohanellus kitauei]|uniref:Uncharacterized protein n=1 Tax=Thelohanellus kitauei TaxID=669202 RepID=A0A0C2IXN2_THEKT|nr:hypothetical protein RF11_16422 [Thelohanellus kitauei]